MLTPQETGTPVGANIGEAMEEALARSARTAVAEAAHDAVEPEQPGAVVAAPEAGVAVAEPAVQVLERPAVAHPAEPSRTPMQEKLDDRMAACRLVAIEMLPEQHDAARGESPLVTLDATYPAIGTIIIGPEAGMRGKMRFDGHPMRFDQFVSQLRVYDLRLNNFSIIEDRDPQGRLRRRIVRGSLITEPSGVYSCPDCRKVYHSPSPRDLMRLQERVGGARARCFNPECMNKPELSWKPSNPTVGAGDPRARRLYSLFTGSEPVVETINIVPDAWAVFRAKGAPTDDMPWTACNDRMVRFLQDRQARNGMAIRSIRTALASQSPGIVTIRMSVPMEWASVPIGDGKPDWVSEVSGDGVTGSGWRPSMAVGWLHPETMNEGLTQQRGYTVRLNRDQRRLVGRI